MRSDAGPPESGRGPTLHQSPAYPLPVAQSQDDALVDETDHDASGMHDPAFTGCPDPCGGAPPARPPDLQRDGDDAMYFDAMPADQTDHALAEDDLPEQHMNVPIEDEDGDDWYDMDELEDEGLQDDGGSGLLEAHVDAEAAADHEADADGWTSDDGATDSGSVDGAPDALPRPKKGTGRWYHWCRMQPVAAGNPFSLLQACFWLAQMKYDFRVSDAALNMFCSLVHYLLLPAGNLFPPSYHLVKAVLGVPDGIHCVRHVCQTCWRLFPELQPEQFQDHCADRCEHCGGARFTVGMGGVPTPKRCAYFFGDSSSFIDLVSKPGTLEAILDYRQECWEQPWTFWGSASGRALDNACRNKFSNPDIGEVAILFSLGATHFLPKKE